MSGQFAQERHDEGPDRRASENDRPLDRLVREAEAERDRLGRLSHRVTGIQTRPKVRRESALNRFDRLVGRGDLSLGRLSRITLLFREEGERDEADACVVIAPRTGRRTKLRASVDQIGRRVQQRLAVGDVIPSILFRERPHVAHLAPQAEAIIQEERQKRVRTRQRRIRRQI